MSLLLNKKAKLRSAQAEIEQVASEVHLDKEQVRKALEAADRALRSVSLREGGECSELHFLVATNPDNEEVQALIDKDPDALRKKDGNGWLPLHLAAMYGASKEVVQLLIKKYPDAVREKDSEGDLPLHIAVGQKEQQTIQLEDKKLAWEDAVAENAAKIQPEMKKLLKEAYQQYAEEYTEDYPHDPVTAMGNTAFLPEIKKLASVEVIQLLIKEYPDAAKEKNNVGNLPLHCAITRGASAEVIQLLIKEYPDAVEEKDQLSEERPLDRPEIKEIHERVVTVVQNLTRSEGLLGDHAKGKDQLGVKEEAQAIANTIAFKDLKPPFVVGILGGWGSGKSFTFHLIEEHLKEIQKFDLTNESVKLDFPYVGHMYPIDFDAWTYAKGCLWSGLMNRTLTSLNDQLDLEAAIGPKLLMKGVSVIELMDEFTTSGEIEYLKKAVKDGKLKAESGEWEPRGGNITKALIDATNSKYDDEVKQLEDKKHQRQQLIVKKKQQLAWEDVFAKVNPTFPPEIRELVEDAYTQYTEENPGEVPLSVDAAMNSLMRHKGMFGQLKRLRAGKLSSLWLTVFLFSLILAVVIPLFLKEFGAIVTAIGPLVSGILVRLNNARAKLRSVQEVIITKVASEMNLDKEQVEKALKAANKAVKENEDEEKKRARGRNENDEENQQDTIQKLNAEINSLEGRVWLMEGDSLNKVVTDRLRSNNYEEHLGVVHQAQKDLKQISDAMLSSNRSKQKERFPRGEPRIVLFIDDLDRCPPKKVVETLEAVQLLVKTKLFVVVLAIDAQYVTLCLEEEYQNILRPERHPSGLDYIEKIIQLPYRVPPISAEYMTSYLQEQMNPEEGGEDSRELSAGNVSATKIVEEKEEEGLSTEVGDEPKSPGRHNNDSKSSPGQQNVKTPFLTGDMTSGTTNSTNEGLSEDTPMTVTAQSVSKEPLVSIPTKVLKFTSNELQSLDNACVFSGVGPRSVKRIVNVFKLIKIIWHDRDQTPGVDTPLEVNMKEACILILALCASNSRSVRDEMCKVLAKIEQTSSMPAATDCGNLKDFVQKALGESVQGRVDNSPLTMICGEKCNKIFEKVKWEDDEQWKLVKKDLRLLRSFSFVREYNELVGDIR